MNLSFPSQHASRPSDGNILLRDWQGCRLIPLCKWQPFLIVCGKATCHLRSANGSSVILWSKHFWSRGKACTLWSWGLILAVGRSSSDGCETLVVCRCFKTVVYKIGVCLPFAFFLVKNHIGPKISWVQTVLVYLHKKHRLWSECLA